MATNTNNPQYDRAAIMRAAWEMVRTADLTQFNLRLLLKNALRTAWQAAKTAAFYAAGRARRMESAEYRVRIIESSKTFPSSADIAEIYRIRAEARA